MTSCFQSFWLSSNLLSGWRSVRYHLMGWALSAYSIHKHQGAVSLYTNSEGAEVLIGKLQLPYDNHELIFDNYQSEFEAYSFLKKLRAYATPKQPFLHIDGDAFLFESLPSSLYNALLVAQNYEYNHPCYEDIYRVVKAHFVYIPEWLRPNARGYISAANTGLVGGIDWAFYDVLEREVLYFLEQNRDFLHLPTPQLDFCVFLEQAFFQLLAEHQQKSVQYLLPQEVNESFNYRLDRWQDVPLQCGYLHLMNYKRNATACELMAQRLYIEAPELYEQCERVTRELEATHHAVLLPEPLAYEGHWRSAQLPAHTPTEVMVDIAQYEQEKQEWIAQLPPVAVLWERWRTYSVQVNALLSLLDKQLIQKPLQQSSYLKRLCSEWNWVEANEFWGQEQQPNYTANATLPAAYHEVVLYVYLHERVVKEQLLDIVGILLLDTFEEVQPLGIGIEAVWQQIKTHQPTANEREFKASLMSRVRFYLYQGVLESQ